MDPKEHEPHQAEKDFLQILSRANDGYADAQNNLGVLYYKGDNGLKNDIEAVKWYRKAADQGHAEAQLNLGIAYDLGHGVLEDHEEAAQWYRKAADQGHAGAQLNLGIAFHHGRGVLKDYVEAYTWFSLSALSGREAGILYKNNIAREMTPEQIGEAELTPEQVAEAVKLSKELAMEIENNQKEEDRENIPVTEERRVLPTREERKDSNWWRLPLRVLWVLALYFFFQLIHLIGCGPRRLEEGPMNLHVGDRIRFGEITGMGVDWVETGKGRIHKSILEGGPLKVDCPHRD